MKYSTKTYRILKTMYKNGSANRNLFPSSELHRLFQDHYIINSTNYHDENVYLTEDGRAHVEEIKLDDKRYKEEKRRSWIQFWIPVVISIVALIGAYRQELVAIIRAIEKLLK